MRADGSGLEAALAAGATRLTAARARPLDATLALICREAERCGVTRAASVTGLDTLGIPTWVAVRPDGLILQVSNGKGLTDTAARISAVMEAVELHHAEHPEPDRLLNGCERDLRAEWGTALIPPADLPGFLGLHYGPERRCEWTEGEEMGSGARVLVPASAVYFLRRPGWHDTSSNGLASGNTVAEASLHGLYEVIERDAMGRLRDAGRLRVRERGRVVDPATVDDPVLAAMIARCAADGTRVVMVRLPAAVDVAVFWVVLLSTHAIASVSTLNTGWGCHADPAIAAARAFTEAAQSRLGCIHGARDDLIRKPVHSATAVKESPAFRHLAALRPNSTWTEATARGSLAQDMDADTAVPCLVSALLEAGCGPVLRFNLSVAASAFAVCRIIAPRLSFAKALF
jgi:ribosomal protein S12 methylthiotransferase accessory factor